MRRRLSVLLAVAAVAFAIAGVVMLSAISVQGSRRIEVTDRDDAAAIATRDLTIALLDQETAVRGFILSDDPAFLAPYEQGISDQKEALGRLEPALAYTPDTRQSLAAVRSAISTWQTTFALPAIAQTKAGQTAPRGRGFQDRGKQHFDDLRAALTTLDDRIRAQRAHGLSQLTAAYHTVLVAVIVSLIGLIAVGLIISVALDRVVIRPLDLLGDDVRRVADGQLDHPITGYGPSEFLTLADDVEHMRLRLLDELVRLNEATTQVEEQARDLARSNADLEQFAYVASHDLQEPLRKVAGFCQLLERRYGGQLDEQAEQYIHYAVDGAKRMQDLINDLLDFSRVGRLTERFVPVEMDDVLDRALANLETAIDDTRAVVDRQPLPLVEGDDGLLTAVMQNLIGNAIKFRGAERPRIKVSASTSIHEGDATNGPDEVLISVSDNGIGIEPKYADQIFTLFQRLHTRSQYPGNGIGLAMCKKIIEFHGGRIWLEPSERDGATFSFTLPVLIPATTAAPAGVLPHGSHAEEQA